MTSVSVVTLAKGRPDHLVNVVRGLSQQTMRPTELIALPLGRIGGTEVAP